MKDNLLPKKMLKISEMVEYLKEKNIKFNIISESEAEIYLKTIIIIII